MILQDIHDTPEVITANLGVLSNSYEGELKGIELGLDDLQSTGIVNSKILYLVDCRPALEASFSNLISKDYNHSSITNKELLLNLKQRGNTVHSMWLPSHKGFQPNELADKRAKLAAEAANKIITPLDRRIVLILLKEQIIKNWQFRINSEIPQHDSYQTNPIVNSWQLPSIKGIKHVFRLISGHTQLNDFQSKFNPDITSPYCQCGQRETIYHYLLKCQLYMRHRHNWFNTVFKITGDISTFNNISLSTLYGQRKDLTIKSNTELLKSTINYIHKTKRFTA